MATKIIKVDHPDLSFLPHGKFKYCSKEWLQNRCKRILSKEVQNIFGAMAFGFNAPRFTYIYKFLRVGEIFGHGEYHKDGFGLASETHRLLTFGGSPTEGEDGKILSAGYIWEFSGDYVHRAQPTIYACHRLLLRVSDSEIPYRNRWEELPRA